MEAEVSICHCVDRALDGRILYKKMLDLGVIQFSDLTLANKEYKEKKSLNLSLETWKICIHLKGTMGTDICFMCLNALACKGVITAPNTLQMAVPHSPPQDVTSFLPHMPPFMFPFI